MNEEISDDRGEILLTLREACQILKCHPNTLRKWDRKGVLVAIRFGSRRDRRYKKVDIMRLIDQIVDSDK